MKTQQLGPMVSGFFLFSFASSFGTFYRFLLESFDSLGPFFGGRREHSQLPQLHQTCTVSHLILKLCSITLRILRSFRLADEWCAMVACLVGPKNMGFVWKSETSKRMQRPTSFPPNLQIHGANLTLDIMVPPPIGHHGKPLLSEAMNI